MSLIWWFPRQKINNLQSLLLEVDLLLRVLLVFLGLVAPPLQSLYYVVGKGFKSSVIAVAIAENSC